MFPEDPGQVFIYTYALHPQRGTLLFSVLCKAAICHAQL